MTIRPRTELFPKHWQTFWGSAGRFLTFREIVCFLFHPWCCRFFVPCYRKKGVSPILIHVLDRHQTQCVFKQIKIRAHLQFPSICSCILYFFRLLRRYWDQMSLRCVADGISISIFVLKFDHWNRLELLQADRQFSSEEEEEALGVFQTTHKELFSLMSSFVILVWCSSSSKVHLIQPDHFWCVQQCSTKLARPN